MAYKLAVLPGDGVGPEVIDATLKVLKATDIDFDFVFGEVGEEAFKKYGSQVPEHTLEIIKECKVVLYGAATTPPGAGSYRSVAVTIRSTFDLYANIRPIKARKGVPCIKDNIDFVIVRENTEGAYAGIEYDVSDDTSIGVRVITEKKSERIIRFAFELAKREMRKSVTAAHKANILKSTDGRFKKVFERVSREYPEIDSWDIYIDACGMQIIRKPEIFDVIVTPNLLGDIISDVAAATVGGLGIAPSGNIGEEYAMFEPVHGSAPKYAGKNVVNPTATILSSVMMLRHIGEMTWADKIETAVNEVLAEGKKVTYDLGGTAKTYEFAEEVVKKLQER